MANNTSTQKLVNELESAVEEAKKLLKVFDETEKVTKDIAEELKDVFKGIDKKTSKGIVEFNKALQETNKLVEDSEKLNQAKIKTETDLAKKSKELSNARIQETKEKQELHKLEQLRNKTQIQVRKERERRIALMRKEAKLNKSELDAYQKKSKELNENRKAYKALAAAQKGTTAEGRKLLKNIQALDKELKEIDESVGQNQRSVGKYQDAVKGLNSTIGKLGIAAVISKGVELLTGAFASSREGALEAKIAFSNFTETAKVIVANIVKSFGGIKDLFVAVKDTFADIGIQAKILGLEIKAALTFSDLTKEINELKESLSTSSVSDAIDKIALAFEDTNTQVSEAIKSQKKYLQLQLATKVAISEQSKELAGLQEQRQILQDISDDDTIGFVTRAKAVKEAQKIAIEFGEKEVALAKLKEKLTFEAVKQDLRRENAFGKQTESRLKEIKTSKDLIKIIKETEIAKKVSDENDEAFTQAYSERREAEVESESFKRDQEEKNRKTARDGFEQELDILEEFTEAKIASNVDIINSDKTSIEEKKKATEENKKLTEDLYNESIRLIKEQGEASIDLRKDLSEQEKEEQKLLLENISSKEIKNELDAKELFNLIRKLDLGEIEEKRLKDAIKINRELNKTNEDSLAIDTKIAEKRKKIAEDSIEVIDTLLSNSRDKQKSELEKELDALDSRIDTVRNAIENGNSEASQSLAELEKQKQENAQKEEKLRKKQIRDEKLIAGLKLLTANNGNVPKTLGDLSILIASLGQIDSFFDGTEDTGTVQKPLDSNGGRTAILHDNERVMTAKQNAKLGGISNEDLADLGAMHNSGNLNGGTTIIEANNKELIAEVRNMTKAVKSIPIQSYNYDSKGKYHEQVIQSNNKKETIKVRVNNLFK
jgi:hypothetical protein